MSEHVFPWWLGYLEGGWLRTLVDPPQGIVGPHLRPGQTALDVGSGMGFFTLAMARMVGPAGKVVAVDIEPRALAVLARRAKRAGLETRVLGKSCQRESLGLDEFRGRVDFALAFSVADTAVRP